MFDRLINAISRFFGFSGSQKSVGRRHVQRYTLKIFEDRSTAAEAAKSGGVATLVRSGEGYKWILFTCPCGCDQQIALNLMRSHFPRWEVEVHSTKSFTLHPSVDSTTCGAHFWVRNGQVIWCD
jgi:hypothetical protein